MAKKKTKAKATKKRSAKKSKSTTIGRPKGATSHVPKGLEVRQCDPLDRVNSVQQRPGFRRVVLETIDEECALQLEQLASLLKKKDPKIMKLITPAKKASKTA